MRPLLAIAAAATVILTGCVTPTTIESQFDPTPMQRIHQHGTATIEGQAFARQRGGGVVTAAGEEVMLMVATPFTREVTQHLAEGIPFEGTGVKLGPHSRTTIADADGRFRFENVPAGDYIVATLVSWTVGDRRQGGYLRQEVTASEGGRSSIIMHR